HYEVELGDGLGGGVHGDHGRDGEPVGEVAEEIGVEVVPGAAADLAQLVVGGPGDRQPIARVEDAKVDAELVHALVEKARQVGGAPARRGAHRRRSAGASAGRGPRPTSRSGWLPCGCSPVAPAGRRCYFWSDAANHAAAQVAGVAVPLAGEDAVDEDGFDAVG